MMKRHYEAIAEALRGRLDEEALQALARMFQADNAHFDLRRFKEAIRA